MSDFFDPETLWLNVTNALLGVVALVAILAVARVAVMEWTSRAVARARASVPADTHTFDIAGLGITMADGGERLDEAVRRTHRQVDPDDDPPNIIRSTN